MNNRPLLISDGKITRRESVPAFLAYSTIYKYNPENGAKIAVKFGGFKIVEATALRQADKERLGKAGVYVPPAVSDDTKAILEEVKSDKPVLTESKAKK